jgi:hypothetical protein
MQYDQKIDHIYKYTEDKSNLNTLCNNTATLK